MIEDSWRSISSLDTDELSRFGIICNNFSKAKDNIILLSEDAHWHRGLEINFSGERNEVDLRGRRLPSGQIGLQGNDANVRIDSEGEVVIHAYIYSHARVHIEKPRAIFGLWISVFEGTCLSIGPGSLLAEGVKVFTSDHHSIIDLKTGLQINFPGDVTIGEDVWIASDVTVLKNSSVGKGAIVGARSVVVGTIPGMELWGGQPARCLKQQVSWVASHPADQLDIQHMIAGLDLK